MFKLKTKKIFATAFAAGTMASCMLGMSARAYSPTITKTVSGVKGTLYSDTSYAYATTTCYVKVTHGGTTSQLMKSYGAASVKNNSTNGSSSAMSTHYTSSTTPFYITY